MPIDQVAANLSSLDNGHAQGSQSINEPVVDVTTEQTSNHEYTGNGECEINFECSLKIIHQDILEVLVDLEQWNNKPSPKIQSSVAKFIDSVHRLLGKRYLAIPLIEGADPTFQPSIDLGVITVMDGDITNGFQPVENAPTEIHPSDVFEESNPEFREREPLAVTIEDQNEGSVVDDHRLSKDSWAHIFDEYAYLASQIAFGGSPDPVFDDTTGQEVA